MIGAALTGLAIPAAKSAATAALKASAEYLKQQIAETRRNENDDAVAAMSFAFYAREAVLELEAEYDEIINEAELCDLQDRKAVTALAIRISNYLRVDVLRLVLEEAVSGLDWCLEELSKNASKFWVRNRSGKVAAISKPKDILTEFKEKLRLLATKVPGREEDSKISGFGKEYLIAIECFLAGFRDGKKKPDDLKEIVNSARKARAQGDFAEERKAITRDMRNLMAAFR